MPARMLRRVWAHFAEGGPLMQALAGLDLGDDWLRAVCWYNATRLLQLGDTG